VDGVVYRLLFEFPTSGGIFTSADMVTVTYCNRELDVVIPQMIVGCFAVYFLLDLLTAVRHVPHAVDHSSSSSSSSFLSSSYLFVQRQLYGCLVWNAHNTVFGSKRSVVSAQAAYFLHSTSPSVTWLNSRWWLAACDSALSAVLSTDVWPCIKFAEVSCTECTGQGNDFESIPTVDMETRNP